MVHWGAELFTVYNDAYARILGRKHPGMLGQPARAWWSEMWDQLTPIFDRVLAGETVFIENGRYTPDRDGVSKEAFFTHSHSPLWDVDGRVAGIFLVVTETTSEVVARRDRDAATEQQMLLNEELAHRIKNTMSVVQAIAHQTLDKVEDQEAVTAFGKRLSALAAANDVLTRDQWSTAKLGDVAIGALATFGEDRFLLSGPDVIIGPRATLSLSLMLHELATNAAKYGALTAPAGRVAVDWVVRRDGDTDILDLCWTERGGPPATQPTRKGFGSRLIRMGLTGSGGVELRYEVQGLTVTATAPLYQVQEA
nr:PAS domain-containing sensor histidine kinase [Sphingomonas sp. TX0522]